MYLDGDQRATDRNCASLDELWENLGWFVGRRPEVAAQSEWLVASGPLQSAPVTPGQLSQRLRMLDRSRHGRGITDLDFRKGKNNVILPATVIALIVVLVHQQEAVIETRVGCSWLSHCSRLGRVRVLFVPLLFVPVLTPC